MAIVKVTNSKASIGKAINYVTKEEKTEDKLVSGINCTPETVLHEMKATKEQFRKTDGRQYAHYIHSFKPGEQITHEKAHKLALEISEKQFKGYEVLVATHKDKDHIHSHIIVNSVSYEDGRKLHSSKKDLAEVKELSNKICEREGLSIIKPQKDVLTSFNAKKYKSLEKGLEGTYKSYMLDLWKNVNIFKKVATCKEQFIQNMNNKGYQVNWSDTRKYITYTTPEGKRVRDSNLVKTFKNEKLSKEELLNEFSRNGEKLGGTYRAKGDIGKSILFGRNEVSSGRDDKLINVDKTEQRQTEPNNRPVEERKTDTRARADREHTEIKQGSPSITFGNGGSEERQQSKDRGINPDNTENSRSNTGYIHEVSRDTVRDKQLREGENLEGQSNPILNTTRSDNRIDIDDSRSLSTNNPLDELVKKFDKTLQKAEEREKEKKAFAELQAKAREERKLKLEQKPKVKYKSMDRGWER
ncbi:relaxase/mobilization nuclease domain-containing protein [Clostridium taeniosporum]|uniref:MobA/VirD2-like nuclease domain-containing protein n=1 Tax=Clostridium taeniosporum TaxID=394958 RepID=A0A1D7XNU7_9CLOT|nr:relaxase/mobilization nuclease domain-containing protein [Clostridium taeniosporum]AOR24986.1 hypothetical protein BGI42_14645 [Clostridium taeniosporum]